jgi:hypothetical protein
MYLGEWQYVGRRVMDWWIDLLKTCIHRSKLHFTDHWHKKTSVFSLLRFPLTVFCLRLLPRRFFSFRRSDPLVTTARADLLSTDNSTKWDPGWQPFHANVLLFSSQADFQLNSLTHQPATSRHFAQLNCWRLLTTRLVFSLYNLGAHPTENTASKNPSILFMGGCLAIDWILFPRERVYRPLLRDRCLSVFCLATALPLSVSRSLPNNESLRHFYEHFQSWTEDIPINYLSRYLVRWCLYTFLGLFVFLKNYFFLHNILVN